MAEGEVTEAVVTEVGMCGTPGCTRPDFHDGPCSSWGGLCEARKRRKPSRPGDQAFVGYGMRKGALFTATE